MHRNKQVNLCPIISQEICIFSLKERSPGNTLVTYQGIPLVTGAKILTQ